MVAEEVTTKQEQQKDGPKTFSLEEVGRHKMRDSCWLVIHDHVYDVTKFLDEVCMCEEIDYFFTNFLSVGVIHSVGIGMNNVVGRDSWFVFFPV